MGKKIPNLIDFLNMFFTYTSKMFQRILFATIFLSKLCLYKCEIKSTKTKLQAIIMPFDDKPEHKGLNYFNKIALNTNRIKNRNNIKVKNMYITVWLKKNIQVKWLDQNTNYSVRT